MGENWKDDPLESTPSVRGGEQLAHRQQRRERAHRFIESLPAGVAAKLDENDRKAIADAYIDHLCPDTNAPREYARVNLAAQMGVLWIRLPQHCADTLGWSQFDKLEMTVSGSSELIIKKLP